MLKRRVDFLLLFFRERRKINEKKKFKIIKQKKLKQKIRKNLSRLKGNKFKKKEET